MKQQSIGVVLIFSILLFLTQGCGPLKNPGSRGNIPPIPPLDEAGVAGGSTRYANAVIEIENDNGIPDSLTCGNVYVFTAKATQIGVQCEGYNYSVLYLETLRHADERIQEIQCPNECPERNPYIIAHSGSCNNQKATVTINMAVQCIKEGVPPINGLAIPSDLPGPFEDRLPDTSQTPNERLMIESRPNRFAEDCPFDFKFWITLQERVNSCDAIADYAPFVAKAERKAANMWQATRCGPDCTKKPLVEVGADWNCAQNVVTIRYAFQVPCQP